MALANYGFGDHPTPTPFYFSTYAVFINDNANANNTAGLTINQLTYDDECLTLKSSDVNHPFTTKTEADTYFMIKKDSASQGTARLSSFVGNSTNYAMVFEAHQGKPTTSVANPAFVFMAFKADGAGGLTTMNADEYTWGLKNNTDIQMMMSGHSTLFIGNETTNANMEQGITIQQSGHDTEILALKSSDVAHPVTTDAEADTYGHFLKTSATVGGLKIRGFSDGDLDGCLFMEGVDGAADPTDTNAAVILQGSKWDSATGRGTLGNSETVLSVQNYGTAKVRVLGGGTVLLSDTGNAFMTLGLTINQGAADDEIIALKSSDVGHPMTGVAEADTYATFKKASATGGGLKITAMSDLDSGPFAVESYIGVADPTDTVPAISFSAGKTDGGTGTAALAVTETVLQIKNYSTALVSVLGSGHTGIGDAAPATKLEISGVDAGYSAALFANHANVAHGMTGIVPTDVYFAALIHSTDNGGMDLRGMSDADNEGLILTGISGGTPTVAPLVLIGGKKSTTTWAACATTEPVLEIRNFTTSLALLNANGMLCLNDTANANMTAGLTINQGANDDAIISLKSSDVGHPFTALVEADTFASWQKYSATGGGLDCYALTDGAAAGDVPWRVVGKFGHASPTSPAFIFTANKTDGATGSAALASGEYILQINNHTTSDILKLTAGGNLKQSLGTGGINYNIADASASITAAHTITIAVNVPSGSVIVGCQLHVTSALAAGETWNAAYAGGNTQTIAHEEAVAANTKINVPFDGLDTGGTLASQAAWAAPVTTATTTIAIQKHSNPGVDLFTAQGAIRALVYYRSFTAMTSV